MKSALVKLHSPETLTRFGWSYQERKVGIYLTLTCPLRVSPDGQSGWVTRFIWNPFGYCHIVRTTYKIDSRGRRILNGAYGYGEALLGLKPDKIERQWRLAGYTPDGDPIEYEVAPRVLTYCRLLIDIDETGDKPLPIEPVDFHTRVEAFIRAAAEEGSFVPLVDWLCDEWPSITPLFHEPGVV